MTCIKVTLGLFLLTNIILICNGQLITPDQLREQYALSYGARTHYELSGSRRTDMFNRVNPDYLLQGFFPFWSIILICFALIFLTLAVLGLIGYLLGCRRPTIEEIYANEFEQLTPDEEFLLGAGGIAHMNDTKISIQHSSNGFFDNSQRDFRYESLPPIGQIRMGQSHEHMVLSVYKTEGLIECVENAHLFLEFKTVDENNDSKSIDALKKFIDESPD